MSTFKIFAAFQQITHKAAEAEFRLVPGEGVGNGKESGILGSNWISISGKLSINDDVLYLLKTKSPNRAC